MRARIHVGEATGQSGAEELHDVMCVLERSFGCYVENTL